MARDLACGIVALALAAAYFAAASRLPSGFLSDEVGAGGVPKLLAVLLGLLGALAAARAMLAPVRNGGITAHWRAGGMLALGVLYALAMPWLGYPIATGAAIFTIALYAGVAPTWRALAISVAGALLLWLCFVRLLGIALPGGIAG